MAFQCSTRYVECFNLEQWALFGTFVMLDSIFPLWNRWNWQNLELDESPCHSLSKSAIVCAKTAIVLEKCRRECEVFEVTKYMACKDSSQVKGYPAVNMLFRLKCSKLEHSTVRQFHCSVLMACWYPSGVVQKQSTRANRCIDENVLFHIEKAWEEFSGCAIHFHQSGHFSPLHQPTPVCFERVYMSGYAKPERSMRK